jgi:adenine-specific DNA-methyltransferase
LASSGARAEADELSAFIRLAESIPEDAKAGALLTALPELFSIAEQRGARRKVVIFTESRKTQEYLQQLLEAKGYAGKLVLMNGENKDPISKATLAAWKARHAENFAAVTSKNPQADMKAAIVEAFREDAEILLATESAAEGINLQFCSVVINYDLPWNPQRIEQRIGRCHRYGQKSDVLVVNFASTTNAADARVLELLDQKFNLFNGVFGASDSVLGLVESGVNLAKRITDILQTFRTPDEINAEFEKLQDEVGDKIAKAKDDARQKVLEHFDADVARTLQVTHTDARLRLAEGQRMLLGLAEVELGDLLEVEDVSFRVKSGEYAGGYHLDWKQAEEGGLVHFRPGHALAEKLVQEVRARPPTSGVLELEHSPQVSALGVLRGRDDVLVALERYEVTTLGRLEGHVIVALLVSGEALPPEVARKVFELGGRFAADAEPQPVPAALVRAMTSRAMELGADAERRATVHYESQVKQIDRQLDDVRNTIQLEIDELSRAIKEVQRRREKALTLDERLVCDGEQKELQKKRKQRERERFDRQDELDEQRNTLVDALRDKKDDRKVERTPIGWARVRVCG